MDARTRTSLSKFLSFVLRHEPHTLGLMLDAQGWTDVDVLLERLRAHGREVTRELLDEVVAQSDKRRFAYSEDGRHIRANQGHSVEVELGLPASEPPEHLFHGTPASALPAIRVEGLRRMQRHHVHLSHDPVQAERVGARRGAAVVLRVRALAMHRAGHRFFVSANAVWLTDSVPPEFIEFP